MLKTEENNCKESKWKLVLISSLNVLRPGHARFQGVGIILSVIRSQLLLYA